MFDARREKSLTRSSIETGRQKVEAPGDQVSIRQALQAFLKFLHQFSVFVCSRRFPPIRSPFLRQAILGIELPIALLARGTPRQ
jgi:hypothetical protein